MEADLGRGTKIKCPSERTEKAWTELNDKQADKAA